MEENRLLTLYRDPSRRVCEIRWDFERREPVQRTKEEQRLFLQLGPNLVAVNVWLTTLGADRGYSFGTIYEYGKVLLYTLTWLTQKPVQLGTTHAIPLTLFRLGRADMRALFAWLDIPAKDRSARQMLCQTGQLPIGFREQALSAATRNLRLAALSTFYDWLMAEYLPENVPLSSFPTHPLERPEHPLSPQQLMQQPDGLLPQNLTQIHRPSKLFRRRLDAPVPQALSPVVLQKLSRKKCEHERDLLTLSQAATPKSLATNATWPLLSPLSTPCTCPFLIMFITSNPCSVRHAVSKEKKPIPGFVNLLMKR